MMETVEFHSTPTTPQKGENNPATQELKEEISNIVQEDVIVSDAPGSLLPNATLKGENEVFLDPGAAAQADRVPTPPDLRPTGTGVDNKSLSEKLLDLQVTQSLFRTYDRVAEATGAPNIEKIGTDLKEVHEQWKGEGIVAAAKTATTKSIDHTTSVTKTTYAATRKAADNTWANISETTTNITNKSIEKTKPYLQRVVENPQVDRVVGSVRSASVGAGSMATTIAASVSEKTKTNMDAAKSKMDNLRGYTPEYAAKQASEEEAWRQVLCAGNGGEELHVPARQELTSSFFVKSGSMLTWRFRVDSNDIGFAIRLRVQGDGGSTEVDVFAMQKYSSGVTVQGEWSPVHDASLVIVWDNSYSYLREKVVAFQASVKVIADHLAEQQAAADQVAAVAATAAEELASASASASTASSDSKTAPTSTDTVPAVALTPEAGSTDEAAVEPVNNTEVSAVVVANEDVQITEDAQTTEATVATEATDQVETTTVNKTQVPETESTTTQETADVVVEEKEKDADY